ncbi:MAG: hypothetical protein MRY21_05670 [Simkaniaceae bacterium]|nr:hypothetical protein [Simkaniaceae bacterium]
MEVQVQDKFSDALLEQILSDVDFSDKELPFLTYTAEGDALCATIIAHARVGLCKFIYAMFSRWLVPGRTLEIPHLISLNFQKDGQKLNLTEVKIPFREETSLQEALYHLRILENEIRIGANSLYHAGRILELKGIGLDEKTALIQERLAHYVYRMPQRIDHDIFAMMQHVFMTGKEAFRLPRSTAHLSRIIGVMYTFYSDLNKKIGEDPSDRHILLKIIRPKLALPIGTQTVLGLFVGLNFIKEHEVFNQKHLLEAVSNFVSGVRIVEDSYIVRKSKEGTHLCLYLEIEKESGYDFTKHEVRLLKRMLAHRLRHSIQHLIRPIFMPRNEEEVMKHIVTLSKQVRFVKDLPQVVIQFEKVTDRDLIFTIIMVRVILPVSQKIEELLSPSKEGLFITVDRVKNVGIIRRKYPKEAAVLRVRLPSRSFLRQDHSIDLFSARQKAACHLESLIGEFRDFNGGMISGQMKRLKALKESVGDQGLLLENYFHTLEPKEMISIWKLSDLKKLYLQLEECINMRFDSEGIKMAKVVEENKIYCVVGSRNPKDITVEHGNLPSSELIQFALTVSGVHYTGYVSPVAAKVPLAV